MTIYDDVPKFHKDRLCKKCSQQLELSRWLECLTCKPELGEENEYLYHTNDNESLDDTDLEDNFGWEDNVFGLDEV